jgi:hypothetical protein
MSFSRSVSVIRKCLQLGGDGAEFFGGLPFTHLISSGAKNSGNTKAIFVARTI